MRRKATEWENIFKIHEGKVEVKVKVAQSCLTLCDPTDYTVHGILQARILEWVAVSSPGGLSSPGIESRSPTFAGGFFTS